LTKKGCLKISIKSVYHIQTFQITKCQDVSIRVTDAPGANKKIRVFVHFRNAFYIPSSGKSLLVTQNLKEKTTQLKKIKISWGSTHPP